MIGVPVDCMKELLLVLDEAVAELDAAEQYYCNSSDYDYRLENQSSSLSRVRDRLGKVKHAFEERVKETA